MKCKYKYRKILIFWLFIGFAIGSIHAQSSTFRTFVPVQANHSHKLYFRIESTAFFKNNEYFSPYAYGFTGIGIYIKPTLEYYFSKKLKITAGTYLLKYSGLDKISQAIPIFSVQYRVTKSFELVMGNIYGTANHRLEEPLFRFDRFYQHHIEYGLQFLWHNKRIHSDLWLNWEHFIQLGDTAQEQLTVGNSTRLLLLQQKGFRLILPIQFLIKHKGGQLAPEPRPPVTTIFNGLSGLRLAYNFNKKSSIQFSQLFLLYKALSYPSLGQAGHLPFGKGWASYSKIDLQLKSFHLMAGYWSGQQFIAPLGETLFQSVSEINPETIQKNRSLITGKLSYRKSIARGIKLEARAASYFDTDTKKIDYSYGLYIRINTDFFLCKVKKNQNRGVR